MLNNAMLIFLGSGLGGVLRHGLSGAVQRWWGPSFPAGTLAVNVSGCLAIGLLAAMLSGPNIARDEHRLILIVGVLGGYTTFSAFGRETMLLVADDRWLAAATNVLLSNALGLIAVWVGASVSTWCFGSGPLADA